MRHVIPFTCKGGGDGNILIKLIKQLTFLSPDFVTTQLHLTSLAGVWTSNSRSTFKCKSAKPYCCRNSRQVYIALVDSQITLFLFNWNSCTL